MRIRPILCAVAAASMAAVAATSCQSEENVLDPAGNNKADMSDCEKISLSVSVADGAMRTRAGDGVPSLSYGTDGLYSFTRDIDRLWYAVYNNGTLLYHSEQPGIPQASYDDASKSFTLDIQVPRIDGGVRLSDYSVFFFAGNSHDKVETREIADGIGLDFANKTMYAYPALLNRTVSSGDLFNPRQYDYFAKYTTLDKVVPNNDFEGTVTLTRPFCQVSLLTDELRQSAVISTYASDKKVSVSTSPAVFTQKNVTTARTLPYGWNYGADNILTKDIAALNFSLAARAFDNPDGSKSVPQEITFKTRKMYCVASYLMLAPDTKKGYAAASDKEQFRFDLSVTGNLHSTDATVSVDLPKAGLKANEKYVVYNKKYDPSTGEGGGGGILSSHYLLDIVVDPAWEGTGEIGF